MLLDLIEEVLDRGRNQALRIEVFDTLDCKSHEGFDKYIPGLGEVFQTPVVGLWQNGVLTEKAWGKART